MNVFTRIQTQLTAAFFDFYANTRSMFFAPQLAYPRQTDQRSMFHPFQHEINQLASSFFQVDAQNGDTKRSGKSTTIQVRTLARILVFPIFLIVFVIIEITERLRIFNASKNDKSNVQNSSENTYIKKDDLI